MYWKEGFFVPQRHSPCTNGQITLIGTREGSLLYQSSLSGQLVHRKALSCTNHHFQGDWYTGSGFPVPFWSGPRAARLPRYPSVSFADSSLGERAASSSGDFTKKAIRNPDGLWSGKRDLNSRPRPWQGRALPTELFPQTCYP